MNRLRAVALMLVVAPLGSAAASEAYLKIDGMKSDACAEDVSAVLKKTKGVSQVEVSQKHGGAWVEYTGGELTEAKLAAKVTAAGYPAAVIPPEKAKAMLAKAREAERAAAPPPTSGPLPPWEPVDAAFRGCEGGCGVRGEDPSALVQPGAAVGKRVYCPVSGVTFEVKEDSPKAEVDGKAVYFCCQGCARHFAAERADVLAKRRIAAAKP